MYVCLASEENLTSKPDFVQGYILDPVHQSDAHESFQRRSVPVVRTHLVVNQFRRTRL